VSIPGVAVQEMIRLPEDLFRKLGTRAADAPLAVVLTRHRADPAEVNRSDPEWALQRTFTLDTPLQLTLDGTARLHAEAPDARVDQALGLPGAAQGGFTAQATGQVAGSLHQRGSAAFDGDAATWWTTPFDTVAGQAVELDAGRTVRLDEADLTVVADAEHSAPKRVAVSADGGAPVVVDVPPVTPAANGTTTRVRVPLPKPVEGRRLRFEVTDVEPRFTTDWFTQGPSMLPVSIAEIAVPGLPTRSMPAEASTACRTDLLAVDGSPVGVRVAGSTADALSGEGLEVTTCDGKPLTLAPGRHDVVAAKGADTGIDLDRLVLTTPRWSAATAAASDGGASTDEGSTVGPIEHHGPARADGKVRTDGEPFWLRLQQSMNDGWKLDIDDAEVDGPITLDSNATGWLVTPKHAGTLAYSVTWTPQRTVDIAVILTALSAVLCFALVVVGWRRSRGRTRTVDHGEPELLDAANAPAPASVGVTVAVALGTGVLAAILIHPWVALAAAPLAAITLRLPRAGRFLPAALVALAAAQIVWYQQQHDYELDRDWAQHFPGAHLSAFLGVVLLAVGAGWEVWGRRGQRRGSAPASAGDDGLGLEEVEESGGGAVPREPVGVAHGGGAEPGA
jgi:hypothetical protein